MVDGLAYPTSLGSYFNMKASKEPRHPSQLCPNKSPESSVRACSETAAPQPPSVTDIVASSSLAIKSSFTLDPEQSDSAAPQFTATSGPSHIEINSYAAFQNVQSALLYPPQQPTELLPPQSLPYNTPFCDTSLAPMTPTFQGKSAYNTHEDGPIQSSTGVRQYSPMMSSFQTPSPCSLPPLPSLDKEDAAILEEKRRKNTEASARFRIKRKQKSSNLERAVSDLTLRAENLEREAFELRRQNAWLKEIVIMKRKSRSERQIPQEKESSKKLEEEIISSAEESDLNDRMDKRK